jgi:hypothetical protein
MTFMPTQSPASASRIQRVSAGIAGQAQRKKIHADGDLLRRDTPACRGKKIGAQRRRQAAQNGRQW